MPSQDLRARVKENGWEIYLGKYPTPEEARAAEDEYCEYYGLPKRKRRQ